MVYLLALYSSCSPLAKLNDRIQRFEVLFGLSNAIFLLFIGMNMLKESLEHMMLEDGHHGNDNERGT